MYQKLVLWLKKYFQNMTSLKTIKIYPEIEYETIGHKSKYIVQGEWLSLVNINMVNGLIFKLYTLCEEIRH